MKKVSYPAVFHKAEEGGFWAQFPDLPECFTQGETMEECYKMATEVLALAVSDRLEKGEELPEASVLENLQIEDGKTVMVSYEQLVV